MSSPNPYQPPQSPVDAPRVKRKLGAAGLIIVVLVGIQTIWSAANAFASLERVQVGELSPFGFLLILASGIALAAGGVFLLLNFRSARYAAAIALIFGALLLIGSHDFVVIGQAVVAACLLTFTLVHFRAQES